MVQDRQIRIAWVSSHILPYEGEVRAWLRQRGIAEDRIDDIVQEAYCRISALDSLEAITNGRAYLFRTVRNLILENIRRARIVRIDSVAEIERWPIIDDEPSPEQVAVGRMELQRVENLIRVLPERCRRIFVMRRVQQLPQREIASRLGVSENTVEAQSARGLKQILKALADEGCEYAHKRHASVEKVRKRTRR